ncbi:hypothetical protein GGI1_12600 [Acidithiobacillus sp. GGI-221]|nr:hypothetical protein GGI1_12600 [Acidithiobacillus sp. GGI-221]
MVNRRRGAAAETQTSGRIGLGIEVDEEDALAVLGESGGQIDGGGGLTHPPF